MQLRLLCAWFVAGVHRTPPRQEAQRFHTISLKNEMFAL
jgi:hypothetical protein